MAKVDEQEIEKLQKLIEEHGALLTRALTRIEDLEAQIQENQKSIEISKSYRAKKLPGNAPHL
jgi:hypothetical protein